MNSPVTGIAGSTGDVQFMDSVRRSHPSERRDLLLQFLRKQLAASLAVDPSRIGVRDNLLELGIDSFKAVEFKFFLESKLGLPISSSLIFDYPNLDVLTGFLLEQICPLQKQPALTPRQPQRAVDLSEDELARLVARELREMNLSPTD
jgi:acyl carrier protein